MSGGSHNYVYYQIEENLCGQMKDAELNDLMKDVAKLAHDLEWADSCDISEETYFKTVNKFKAKWFGSVREDRLKKYIDKAIERAKKELYTLVGDI